MKLSEKLLLVANWLQSEENDLLVNAEKNDGCLNIVASALVKASEAIKEGAIEVDKVYPKEDIGDFRIVDAKTGEVVWRGKTEEKMLKAYDDMGGGDELDEPYEVRYPSEPNKNVVSDMTSEKLDDMAAIAQAFDESGDELLQKQASVLDEILMTFGANKNALAAAKQKEDDRIEQLKKKYKDPKVKLDEMNKISDSIKDIEKSPSYKKYRILEAPLSTRVCPEHFCQIARVGEHRWQCVLDGKVYDYEGGFTTMDGDKVPGGDVSEQTKIPQHENTHAVFDTRPQRLGQE